VLDKLPVSESQLVDVLPQRLTDTVARQIPGDHPLYDVDFDNTTAFFHGTSNLYVNRTDYFDRGTVPPEDVDDVKRTLRDIFENTTDPETGDRIFELIDGDELFPNDDHSPDFVVEGRDEYLVRSALSENIVTDTGSMEATHDSEGIFFALGPSVEATHVTGATVYDVAPTALHSIGEPIPKQMDGEVLETALTLDTAPQRQDIEQQQEKRATSEDDDFGEVEDRLRGLGYIE